MSAFQPKNPDHAIAAVAFTLSFRTALNEAAIAKAREIEPSVKDFLPGLTSLGELPAAIALTGAQSLRFPRGIIFQRVKPDATPSWLLTAQQNFIAAECSEYTRWEDTWGRVRTWLRDLYTLVKDSDHLLHSVGLQYKDQFSATKPLDSDVLQKIFQRDTCYLPDRTFQNNELWHVNQGWYQPMDKPMSGRQLNVINITTQDVNDVIILNIDHLLRYEMDDGDPPLFANQVGSALIDIVMEDMHARNKSFLRRLLSAEMAKRIKLDD
jgi:uncharacterized protein (TIGR04255 family)